MTSTQAQPVNPAEQAEKAMLAKFASKPYERPDDVTAALAQLSEHFPVVAPGGTTRCAVIADGYKALVTYVVAEYPRYDNDNKEIPGTGDVFKDRRTNQWCFKHAFLKKLAAGAGIEWVDEERMDNFSHPFVCAMKVKGKYRDYSGEWRQVIGSHQLDLRDEAEHGKTAGQLKAARGTIQQLCASMAKSRAIADACISRTIADADIGRPIIMAKLYRTAGVDPDEARDALYGKPGEPRTPVDDVDSAERVEAEVTDHDTGEVTRKPSGFTIPVGAKPPYAEEGVTFEEAALLSVRAVATRLTTWLNDARNVNSPKVATIKAQCDAAYAEIDYREGPGS